MPGQNMPQHWDYYAYAVSDSHASSALPGLTEQDTIKSGQQSTRSPLKPGSPEYVDSMKAARKAYVDSMKAAQLAFQDSLSRERKRVSDSIRAYNDSLKAAMEVQRIERQRINDSIKAVQQARRDSLAAAKAYRESKAYKDSVALAKQAVTDSLAQVRQARADSLAKARVRMQDSLREVRIRTQDSIARVRKAAQDSMMAARKAYNDSLQQALAEQKARNQALRDSMTLARQARLDSLNKAKEAREAAAKKNIKDREKEKIAKERQKEADARAAYTNESMRKKPWSFTRRAYHNTTTRFNYHFNAGERLKQIEENMLKNSSNQYDSLLPLFPFDPLSDSTKYASDLDSLIRKASVGIHIHDPRSRWQDDLYLIVGKAYYYKGDFSNAAAAFKYIVGTAEQDKKEKAKNKDKRAEKALGELPDELRKGWFAHNTAKNDAIFWLAKTLAQDGETSLAHTILNMVRSSKFYTHELDGKWAEAQSFVALKDNNLIAAAEYLRPVYEDHSNPKWLRQRAAFLRGQLLQQQENYSGSDSAFDKVIALNPELDMDFYARMHKVNNSINNGLSNAATLVNSLQKMSKEQKYQPHRDKIHFALGQVFEAQDNTTEAIAQFKTSAALDINGSPQKGLSYAHLGNLYYKQNNYGAAKQAYDSALAFLTPAQQPYLSIAQQRAGALDYIAGPGATVRYTDSILKLAALSEKDQEAIARKFIKEEEKRLIDSFYAAKNAANAANSSLPAPTTLAPKGQTWYFTNPATVQQGVAAFKQKWGDIPLKDNWNRSNQGIPSAAHGSESAAENLSEEERILAGIPSLETLLAQIPKGKAQTDSAHKVLEKALYELGIGYYKHMEDIPEALKTFDQLDSQYPNTRYAAEILYYRYLIALQQNDKAAAEQYLRLLQTKHAQSEWAERIRQSEMAAQDQKSTEDVLPIAAHYDMAYEALINRDYNRAYQDAAAAPNLYPKEYRNYEQKYQLVQYAAMIGNGAHKEADSLLSLFIGRNPQHETVEWANALQQYVQKLMTQNQASQPATTATTAQQSIQTIKDTSLRYTYAPQNLHYVILSHSASAKDISSMRDVLRNYNQTKSNRKRLEVNLSPISAQRSAIVVQEFRNAQAAKGYVEEIKQFPSLFQNVGSQTDVEILIISNDNILKLYTDQDWEAYKQFFEANY